MLSFGSKQTIQQLHYFDEVIKIITLLISQLLSITFQEATFQKLDVFLFSPTKMLISLHWLKRLIYSGLICKDSEINI